MQYRGRKVVLVIAAIAAVMPLAAQTPAQKRGVAVDSPPIPTTIQQAEHEGAIFPRGDTQTPPPPGFDTEKTIGTADRRCVEFTERLSTVRGRSGEFVVSGEIGALMVAREGKVSWTPFHDPASAHATLLVRGSRLDHPGITSRFVSANYALPATANGSVTRDHAFYPSSFSLPSPGRWLLVATSGDDWGCFIVNVR
jgi:hypothetical protein